jgi:asparagine synthase (glutamine-hydrolysing)
MCGIAGILDRTALLNPTSIKNILGVLKHRGPDDEGYLAINTFQNNYFHLSGADSKVSNPRIEEFNREVNLLLGIRRLSILDISPAGHQPMSNHDETTWVIFNGEIYNYIELREELGRKGVQFKTNCDTEVLIQAYDTWGEQFVHKLNGMWCFVIYDRKKNILFGSRDRFGVKQLYYYNNSKIFAFASEIKALADCENINTTINTHVAFDFLVMNRQHEDYTEGFFKNIFELLPGHSFKVDLRSGMFSINKYYELNYLDKYKPFDANNFEHEKETIKQRIYNSVKLRLRSDVPVGSCLSGGMDSSAIVCIIKNILDENGQKNNDSIKVFTAAYKDAFDESKWAEQVINKTQFQWFKTYPESNSVIDNLEELVYAVDAPVGSTSTFAQWSVMELAQQNNMKVLLDGQGGDEIFAGYPLYYAYYVDELIKNGKWKVLQQELSNLSNSPVSYRFLLKYLFKIYARSNFKKQFDSLLYSSSSNTLKYLSPQFRELFRERLKALYEEECHSLNHKLHNDITGSVLRYILRCEDRVSMHFSIESRTPFSDDVNLIEHMFKLPASYKIHNGQSKFIFRDAMQGIVPQSILQRRDKVGFATPQKKMDTICQM